ncbi:Threonylcarbamoyl-AMP synthase [compost metagenome]
MELKVDYIIDGGNSEIGIESTVVKVENDTVIILRPGKITLEDIEEVVGVGKVKLSSNLFNKVNENTKVESPGMKHKHYAPNSKCVLVYDEDEIKLIKKVHDVINNNLNRYKKIGVICFDEHVEEIKSKFDLNKVDIIKMGSIKDMNTISKNIFNSLRKVDNKNIDFCVIEGVKKSGIGLGIMNRLLRACEYNII